MAPMIGLVKVAKCQLASRRSVRARGHFLGRGFDHLMNIAAGRERARTGAGQDHDADVVVGFDLGQLFIQLHRQLIAQRVEFFRTVQCDDRDTFDAFGENVLVAHERLLEVHHALQQKRRRGANERKG